jgi:hypothetical protein
MDFTKSTTIAMLADATNAPVYTFNDDGSKNDPQNVAPLDYVDSLGVLKDPHLDYVFYLISFDNENINRQMDVKITPTGDPDIFNRTTVYVRNLKIDWQFYGDDAMEWADTLRMMLYDPVIGTLFAAQEISLIPAIDEAVFIPEKINTQWFHRYDLSARFNQKATLQSPVQVFESGSIEIIDNEGGVYPC